MSIQWPDGIDEQRFLAEYWQKKPLLIRQAFPDFNTPLPADELAGLSLEPETTGRIITCDSTGAYHLEHGPFDEDRFATLTENNWSLLVTDVEKHVPEFIEYLQPFRFIADWRIDDLMISYAPDGASVGAHVDEYDVFLLQGSGVRTWSIDARADAVHEMRRDGDLKIIANYTATDSWDLIAGDMLYLPPNMAHHGIAKGDDCTTWSIGFRAPRKSDLISDLASRIADDMPSTRYTDGDTTMSRHGQIDPSSIKRFRKIWDDAVNLSDIEFARMLGQWLTESNAPASIGNEIRAQADNSTGPSTSVVLQKTPFSRFAFITTAADQACLFVDGMAYQCTSALAAQICSAASDISLDFEQLAATDAQCVATLCEAGALHEA